jgi:alkyl hydroperoxide reductase subunit AhpC
MSAAFVGKPAPDFCKKALVDGDFKDIRLESYRGKWLVLFFYPMDFTFVCPTEIIAFSERAAEFRAINCEIIAASTDSEFSHFAWSAHTNFPGTCAPFFFLTEHAALLLTGSARHVLRAGSGR